MNLNTEKKAYGLITTAVILILLVLITCTCNGVKLTSGNQTFVKPIEYSTSFGKPARRTSDVMECVTLRIDDQGSLSWHRVRWSTWQLYPVIPGMVSCPSPVLTLRRCLQTKSCPYPSTTPSSSSQSKTVWTDPKQKLRSESQRQNLPDGVSQVQTSQKIYKAWTQPSIGRTPVTTPTMGRNSNFSYTTNQGNGRGQTISSTTGGSRKQP